MRAGLLDTPVTFLRRVDAASPYGKGSVTWEEALPPVRGCSSSAAP